MNKKLCIIATSTQSISAFLEKYIDEFSKQNNSITLVSNFSKNQKDYVNLEFLKKYKNLRKIHIPFNRKPNLILDIISLIKLIYIFRINSFDLFFSITPKAGFISSIAGFFSKINIRVHIFTGQVWYTKKGIVRYILKKFDNLIGFLNTNCLADSLTQKEFLLKEKIFNDYDNKIKVIGEGSICGVDTNLFRQVDNETKKKLKLKFGLELDTKIILFLGRLNKDKGVFDLAKAFDLIKKEYKKKLKLVFVGFDEQNCRQKINISSKNSKDIHFFNYNDNPQEFHQIADIYCLPSYREGFGLSALEAGSCNLPSVTSNTVGLTDVIIENKTGLVHDPGDVIKIKENVLKFLNNDELSKDFGNYARERIIQKFDSKKIINLYVEYFNSLNLNNNFALIGTSANSIYNFRGSFIKFLKKNKFNVDTFAGELRDNDKLKIKDLDISYSNYSVSNSRFNILKEIYVMIKLFIKLKRKKPKIIFSYTLKAVIFIGLLKNFGFFKKVKSLAFITGVGNAFIDYNKSISTKIVFIVCKFLYKISLKNYNKVLFQNKDDQSLFLDLSIIRKNNLSSIIPSSGVEIKNFNQNQNIYPENVTFGLASRMIVNKGILEFCSAAKNIKKRFPYVNFIIIGDFDRSIYSLEYNRTIEKFKEAMIDFRGWENNVVNFYKEISVYVLPSYREGTPRSVLEAMASSRPIITTNVPGCKETVIQDKNGYLVKEKNVKQLQDVMEYFIKNKDLIKPMGRESFNIACEKFDVEIINKKLLDEIYDVIRIHN